MPQLSHRSEQFRRDPFSQSDRDPIGSHAGKGDRDRSDPALFKPNFPRDMGRNVGKNPGRTRKSYKLA